MFNPTKKTQLFGDLLNQFRSNTNPQFNPNNYGTSNFGLLSQTPTSSSMGLDPSTQAQEQAQKQALLESLLRQKEERKMLIGSPENPMFNAMFNATTGSDFERILPPVGLN